MVRMDDGVSLNTTVFVPMETPPEKGWPAVLFVHGLGGSKSVGSARSYARQGYVTMAYTVRGQGQSEGGAPSGGSSTIVGAREVRDLKRMLEWLVESYGVDSTRVGIVGGSQGGLHSWMAVAHGMGVAAAVPQNFTAEPSKAVTIGGSIHSNAFRACRRGFVDSSLAAEVRRYLLAHDADSLVSQFGEPRNLRSGLAGANIPVMVQFAWEDGWGVANNVIDDFAQLEGPRKLYLGTGGHGSAKVRSESTFRQRWTRRWLDRWLKDEQTGVENEPPVEIALLDLK